MRWPAIAALALAAVAIGVAGAGWWEDAPELTAADAVAATEGALRDAGLDATVEPDPVRTTYASRTRAPVEVWAVRATVRSEPIQLQLARTGARPIAIDDRSLVAADYVLSDAEYESVAAHMDDPARARVIRRNVALTAGAVLVIAVALAHAAVPSKEPR
jgi:hypothetical protein